MSLPVCERLGRPESGLPSCSTSLMFGGVNGAGSMHVGLEDGAVLGGGLDKLAAFYAER